MRVRRRTSPQISRSRGFRWIGPSKWLAALSGGHDRRLFIGAFVVFLVAGYLFAAVALFPAPIFTASKAVPNLIGLAQADALARLQEQGLASGDLETVRHPSARVGDVVWQDPPAGIVVPEGTTVQLSISQGPQQIPVPDVANYTGDLAIMLITFAGLEVRIEPIQTAAPRGLVVNTRPAAGTTLRPGDTVRLLVSVGAPTIPVPNLLGMTLQAAQDTLEALGLVMGGFTEGRSRSQPPGTIFQQEPPSGTLTAPGTRVTGWVVRERP